MHEFRDDDAGYLHWLTTHPDGFVINIARSHRSPRLVMPYRKGVQWNPTDNDCVAGQLLLAEPVDGRWSIKGEIAELDG